MSFMEQDDNENDGDGAVVPVLSVPRRTVRTFRTSSFSRRSTNYSNNDNTTSKAASTTTSSATVTRSEKTQSFPIIGLGCSSFSHFFWSPDELEQVGGARSWTVETMDRHHPQVQEWIQTIHYAIQICGITLLDTAPWYGHGTSEVVVGWALEELALVQSEQDDDNHHRNDFSNKEQNKTTAIQRSDLIINTKVGRYEADIQHQFDFSYQKTVQSVQRSLQRLKCTYIDVLQLHDPEFAPTLQILLEETIPAMLYCQHERQWCKALGMTGYPLEVQHQILVATMTKEYYETHCRQYFNNENDSWVPNGSHFVFDQALVYCHSNLHDDSLFTRCNIQVQDKDDDDVNDDQFVKPEKERFNNTTTSTSHNKKTISYATFLSNHDIILMTAAPLSMGLLTPTNQPPPDWHPAHSELKEACHEAAKICEAYNINLSTLAMTVAMANPIPSCTLLGMKNIVQVQTAAQMAARFHKCQLQVHDVANYHAHQHHHDTHDDDSHDPSIEIILKQVLNETEYKVWNLLRDPNHGPFATVWKNGNFRWDGALDGYLFWKQVNHEMKNSDENNDDANTHVNAMHWQAPPR